MISRGNVAAVAAAAHVRDSSCSFGGVVAALATAAAVQIGAGRIQIVKRNGEQEPRMRVYETVKADVNEIYFSSLIVLPGRLSLFCFFSKFYPRCFNVLSNLYVGMHRSP